MRIPILTAGKVLKQLEDLSQSFSVGLDYIPGEALGVEVPLKSMFRNQSRHQSPTRMKPLLQDTNVIWNCDCEISGEILVELQDAENLQHQIQNGLQLNVLRCRSSDHC